MRWIYKFSLATFATLIAAPALAQVPDSVSEKLACVDTGYTETEQATIDNFVANYSIDDDALAEELGMALGRRTEECVGENADEKTLMMIAQHQFALLSERGIAATRPDIVDVITRIDTKLDPEKRARFMALFDLMVFGDPETGEPRNLSDEDAEWFGLIFVTPPVNGTTEQSELIGAYMAARALRKDAVKQLAAD